MIFRLLAFAATAAALQSAPSGELARCAGCHAEQARNFLATGMGRSMAGGPGNLPDAGGTSGRTRWAVVSGLQQIERRGYRAAYRPEVSIGSGNQGTGFLVWNGEYLFQSPISWYSRRKLWDSAPGFENNPAPDFNRPVVGECLFCHANAAAPARDTLNRYPEKAAVAEPISCGRCHGSGEAHLARPTLGNIVNPTRLPPRTRDAVCEQCHLGGEARILNPDREWQDFRPGMELETVFSVYTGAPRGRFRVAGHSEQLALSRCLTKSGGRIWCGSCHSPHAERQDLEKRVQALCTSCHQQQAHRTVTTRRDCAGCHMPRRKAPDSGHAAFTDHHIQVHGRSPAPRDDRPARLAPWREAPAQFAQRNLALAYLSLGEKEQRLDLLREAGRLLSALDVDSSDAGVAAGLALVRLLQGSHVESVLLLERAVSLRPRWAPYRLNLAAAWKASGRIDKARETLRQGIAADPSVEALYHALAELETGAAREAVLREYLQFRPASIVAREALAGPAR